MNMSFNTSWDVDKYKSENESDELWLLRRKFLIAHKLTYSEDTLLSLAQVFINIKFLECRWVELLS